MPDFAGDGLRGLPVMVIPAYAGMDYVDHWIPACAGMTTGVSFWVLQNVRDAMAAVTGFWLSPSGYRHPRWPVPDAAL